MAYSPYEERSLMNLLAAMQGGMSGSAGYGLLNDIMGQQSARVDARQQRMGSLQDLLVNSAMQGQSVDAASALADAYTRGQGNLPPMIADTLSGLYPNMTPSQNPNISANTPSEVGAAAMAGTPQNMMQMQYSPAGPGAPQPDPMAALEQQLLELQVMQAQTDLSQDMNTGTPTAVTQATAQAQVQRAITGMTQERPQALGDPLPPMTGQEVLGQLVTSKAFLDMDEMTQQYVLQAVQQAVTQFEEQQRQQAQTVADGMNNWGYNGMGSMIWQGLTDWNMPSFGFGMGG